MKVGIFGLTTPATNLLSNPSPAVVIERLMRLLQLQQQWLATLRTVENCDVVIFLSHLGVAFDQVIVSNIPGINVIVGGHDHYKYEEPITMTNRNGRNNMDCSGKIQLFKCGKNEFTC